MPFTVEDFHDLVRLLEMRPEWRAEMRRLVLSDEYLAVPEQIAEFRRDTEQRFREVDEQIAELRQEVAELRRDTESHFARVGLQIGQLQTDMKIVKDDVGQLKGDMKAVKDDIGQLKGENLERRYRERAHAYFGRLVRKAQVVTPEELSGLLEDAAARGVLSASDRDEVGWADLVVRGRWRADDRQVMVLAEISSVVDRRDVLRATDRATLLAKLGTPVVPVVAGASVTEGAANMARSRNVWQMLNGRVVEPAGEAAGDS